MRNDIDEILSRLETLRQERTIWENTWQDIIDYMLPNRAPVIGDIVPGEDRSVEIYDNTPTKSLLRLAASLNSMLTNQSTDWFGLETTDQTLNDDEEVKAWLIDTAEKVKMELDNSNFYVQVHELYMDIGSIGTACMYIEENDGEDQRLNFSSRHIREIFIAESHQGKVDTVFREFMLTARQCVQRWGDTKDASLSEEVIEKFEANPEEQIAIVHVVFPRTERNTKSKSNKNMPWASLWIELATKHVISEGGFRTFPYVVPRWLKSTGETYGRSPALSSLGDIKTLNAMYDTLLTAGQMIAEPPLQVPDDGFMNINVGPRGISYYRAGTNDRIVPLEIGANIPITFNMLQDKRDSIADAFFTSQLQLISKKEMTAEEIRARQQENFKVLGPTMGRLQTEFLQDLIFRIIDLLGFKKNDADTLNVLPIPPAVMGGQQIKVRYVSPLARQQREDDLIAINAITGQALQWNQVVPGVLDNIDTDFAIREMAEIRGAPKGLIVPESDRDKTRKQRAQAQQQMMAQQQAEQKMEMAEKMSKVGKNTANAQRTEAEAKGEI
jgi:hypothetical protein